MPIYKRCILALSLMMCAGAAGAAITCIDAGEFVEGVAKARDMGKSSSDMDRILRQDDTFSKGEKAQLREYMKIVYQNRDIPGKALANMAIDSCYKAGKNR